MAKIGFIGFGEVNTPVDVIIRKCAAAEKALKDEGLDLVSVYPVADDYEETQVKGAVEALAKESEKLSALLSAFDAETLSDIQPQEMNDEEILPDPVVYDTIRFLVRDLEAEGKISCPCGRGSYDFRLTDEGVQVVCPDCGAAYEFIASSPEAAEAYLSLDSLRLK